MLYRKFYVDRLEGNELVCVDEGRNLFRISRFEVVGNVVEGSVLIEKNGRFVVDCVETEFKRKKMSGLQNEVFSDE